jgi:hypothetical protein
MCRFDPRRFPRSPAPESPGSTRRPSLFLVCPSRIPTASPSAAPAPEARREEAVQGKHRYRRSPSRPLSAYPRPLPGAVRFMGGTLGKTAHQRSCATGPMTATPSIPAASSYYARFFSVSGHEPPSTPRRGGPPATTYPPHGPGVTPLPGTALFLFWDLGESRLALV